MAARESNPLVEDSSVPGMFYRPLSTLIPGTIPLSYKRFTNFLPSLVVWFTVSENKITPEICFSSSGVVKSNSLYFLLFSKVFSTSMVTNFFTDGSFGFISG